MAKFTHFKGYITLTGVALALIAAGCSSDDESSKGTGVGGASSTGGSSASSSAVTGGKSATSSSTAATGGMLATGGMAATGGMVAATGGASAAGGKSATGGASATGGQSATGGTTAAGGSSAVAKSIVDIATTNPDFSILAAAAVKAGLVDALNGQNLTVFAPTNAAFAALLTAIGKSSLDDLSADQLRPILLYHVVGAKVDAAAATSVATGAGTVQTLGGTAKLAKVGSDLVLDGTAKVTAADVMASNGIIHVIDHVILPSITDVVVSSASFSSLKTALTVADGDTSKPNLVGAFDDDTAALTLLAPNDAAFAGALTANNLADLPALVTAVGGTPGLIKVLKYHAAAGKLFAKDVIAASGKTVPTLLTNASFTVTVSAGTVTINQAVDSGFKGLNDSKVITTDLYTSNGVIHVIDKVIAPAK